LISEQPPLGAAAFFVNVRNSLSSDASCFFLDPGSRQTRRRSWGRSPTDQRGDARPQRPACDIGAFERVFTQPVPPSADLRLRVKAKPKRPRVGKNFAFLIRVSNGGPDAATGVVVKAPSPPSPRRRLG
jgi:hypothetical protein